MYICFDDAAASPWGAFGLAAADSSLAVVTLAGAFGLAARAFAGSTVWAAAILDFLAVYSLLRHNPVLGRCGLFAVAHGYG